jgi:hypothetical protein
MALTRPPPSNQPLLSRDEFVYVRKPAVTICELIGDHNKQIQDRPLDNWQFFSENGFSCTICQSPYEGTVGATQYSKTPVRLPCGRVFGEDCLRRRFSGYVEEESMIYQNESPNRCEQSAY